MKQAMTLLMLCLTVFGFAQQSEGLKPVPAKVQSYLDQGESFLKVNPFTETIDPDRMDLFEEIKRSAWGLKPDLSMLANLETDQPDYLELIVPRFQNTSLSLLLYKVNVATPRFSDSKFRRHH
ncbi:MAG: hypothetical protein IPJ06_02465 [Saprospiraceae bacterium]|nr:hypothetical protein [Saprospiraceae bacterium]